MAEKTKKVDGGLDENNLQKGSTPTNETFNYFSNSGNGLSLDQSIALSRQARNPNTASNNSAYLTGMSADRESLRVNPALQQQAMLNKGVIPYEINPEIYKTVYQSDLGNAWNTFFNHMRPMSMSGVEEELALVRVKMAEYDQGIAYLDNVYAAGLMSADEHAHNVKLLENSIQIKDQNVDLVSQLINSVQEGLADALSSDDYLKAMQVATESGLLNKEEFDKSFLSPGDTYQSLLERKERLKEDLISREEEIKNGGFGSIFSGITGRGSTFGSAGIPLPFYGGGEVEEDYSVRRSIETSKNSSTALSSIPIFSKLAGLSDSWTGDEYYQYKAAEDMAGSIATFEGQIAAIVGPALIKTMETQFTNKALQGVNNPWIRGASALTQFATIGAGIWWSRNLEAKMEVGDAYWQRVDSLEQQAMANLQEQGINRELTKEEKDKIAIAAYEGVPEMYKKNMTLGAGDAMQFALTFMKMPGLNKAFTGTTFRNIAARELTSRFAGRGLINAAKFSAGVGISREIEGMEEGLQFKWTQDYLGGATQEESGSFLNNYWNATKNTATDAVDYALNMSGLKNSDPNFYNNPAFLDAVQSGRNMATMMTGGGRALSNWGGAKTHVELQNALALLGASGDQINAKNLLNNKKQLLFDYFNNGRSADLYDAIYRMGRNIGNSNNSLLTRQESVDIINEIQQAEKIYNDVFNVKSPLGITALGFSYDIGTLSGNRMGDFTAEDKKQVFFNALSIVTNNQKNKELRRNQEAYREGKDESLELFTTSLTPEEKLEYDNNATSKKRKAALEKKMTDEGVSYEQKEAIRQKLDDRNKGREFTPYDKELLENSKDTERAAEENSDIATQKKTWFEEAMWDVTSLRELKLIKAKQAEFLKKDSLSVSDKVALTDLILEENKLRYSQGFEYNALKQGRLKQETKQAVLLHALGSVIQHLEKYGAKGLNKILPSILENHTKLDPATIEEIMTLSQGIIDERKSLDNQIKAHKNQEQELLSFFDANRQLHTFHRPLSQEEKETLLLLRQYETEGTLDEAQTSQLQDLVKRAQTDKALELLTEEISALEAESAALKETADLSEKYLRRIEQDKEQNKDALLEYYASEGYGTMPSGSFVLNDEDFAESSDEQILRNAALESASGLEYLQDQLKNISNFSDIENAQRIRNLIQERLAIFKRRVVEAEDSKKDYFEEIVNSLAAKLKIANEVLLTVKSNAADRTEEQYAVQQRMYKDAVEALGLTIDLRLAERSIFENIGKIVIEAVGEQALNILRNSLEVNTDPVAVTLILQGLLKNALDEQTKLETKLKTELKSISKSQATAFTNNIKESIGEDQVATELYKENPKTGLKNILHQISLLNREQDFENRESALWKYVDHLSPHKLLVDIQKEDRTNRIISSQALGELLTHHIQYLRAEKLRDILESNINITDQLENEKYIVKNNLIEFIPTKQQLNASRELAIFLNSTILNTNKLTLGGSTAFLQGAAGTGKSKIVLPWALQTSGIPNRKIIAFGHNDSSSNTINTALNLIEKDKQSNTIKDFLELDDILAQDIELIIIDEAPALTDPQYAAIDKKVKDINAIRHSNKLSALKVIMLGDEAQLTNASENISPITATFSEMHTLITPVTSIYRTDNPAIANFQDTFRRRVEDLSNTIITVKLDSSNPWKAGTSGVYGVAANFKERLLLKLQTPLIANERRVIITNPNRVDEYNSFVNANKLSNVEVLSYIEAQGETISEVYMDIVQESDMNSEDYNKAIYTAASRAENLIVAANLMLKNTSDPELHAIQEGLSKEISLRAEEFKQEVEATSNLLNSFTELDSRDNIQVEDFGNDDIESENGEEVANNNTVTAEQEVLNEREAAPEDQKLLDTTEGEELNSNIIPEQGYDETLDPVIENAEGVFDNNIDVSDKHVLYYPEYDALSPTTVGNSVILPLQGDSFVSFVKAIYIKADGTKGVGIVVLQQAREQLKEGTTTFEYKNNNVYRRVAVIGENAEIDKMNFLTKNEKTSLKNALQNSASLSLNSLGIPNDKSLVVDVNNKVSKDNLIQGIKISENGARRLSYKYSRRDNAYFTANQPNSKDFLKGNKSLISKILQMFIEQFYTESQPISAIQREAIKNARVKIFKKKDIESLNLPDGFTIKSGRPYLVIKGVGTDVKTQYIALTPRRLSRDIKDDVKNYFEPIDSFALAAVNLEKLTQGQLKLGTKNFVDFIRGADQLARDLAGNLGDPKLESELLKYRNVIRELKWEVVSTDPAGNINSDTTGIGSAQKAFNKLSQSNSLFRVEKRLKRNGKSIRIVTAKSLLSFSSEGQSKGPITTQLLEALFQNEDSKGYNQVLHLPLDIDMFNDLDSSGVTSVLRSVKDNHNEASKVLTSQLTDIEGTKIILEKDTQTKKKETKVDSVRNPASTTTDTKAEIEKLEKQLEITKATIPVNKKGIESLQQQIAEKNAELAALGTDTKAKKTAVIKGRVTKKRSTGKDYIIEEGEDLKGQFISKPDANKLLKKLLPDLFDKQGMLIPGNIVYLDALRMLELAEGKEVLGKFLDQRIFLLEQREGIYENVVRHEAFHKIVAYYLTDSERKILFATARSQYKLPKSYSDSQVEERLAREFMKFRLDENSVESSIRMFFKKILKFLGFVDKNADNIQQLFENIDSGYFSGKRMVGDPIDTNMDYASIIDQWESIDIYREARYKFIESMDSLLSDFDNGMTSTVSEVNYETEELTGAPMSRDEALNYLVENTMPSWVAEFEEQGLDNLNYDDTIVYKAFKMLSDMKKAKSMFTDIYQRNKISEGYELEESYHLDSVNLSDLINDANLKDHSQNLTESVIEILTGLSYTNFNGNVKRLSIKHAYFKMLQLLTNTYDINADKMRANIKLRSKNLGHRVGTAGKSVEEALIKLIDESFNTLNENNLHQIEVGKQRNKRKKLKEDLKNISGSTKEAKSKREAIRKKIDKLDISDFIIPSNLYFVNNDKFIFSLNPSEIASDLLHDLSGQEEFKTVARKRNESSDSFYYRIFTELYENNLGIPSEALITLSIKNKAARDLKNLIVNTASLREENFMIGDYEYVWNEETKSSDKKLRFYKHKEFGTLSTTKGDISNYIEENISSLKKEAPALLNAIKKASSNKDKIDILKKFMSIIQYPDEKVNLVLFLDQAVTSLEGFLKRFPELDKISKSLPKIESDKTGKMVFDVFTISDLIADENSLLDALSGMLKIEHEASKAHSIKSAEGKTIYAFHNSSFGIDVLNDFIFNRIPESFKEGFYKYNIFVNKIGAIKEIHDWDAIVDKKRKYFPTTYSQEGEKHWLDRTFNYFFLNGLKESNGALYYTQQLTTVSDKSSPKAAQVKLLNDQQIKQAVTNIVDQYNNKPLKRSLVFSNILSNNSLNPGQKVSKIISLLEKRSEQYLEKLISEKVLDNINIDKTLNQLQESKYLVKTDKNINKLVDLYIKNYAVNSFFLNQVVLGDTANFKDSYDVVKRMSVAFAPGYRGFVNPLIGMKNTFRAAVMEDPTATAFDFLNDQDKALLLEDLKDLGLDSPIKLADGQGFILPSRLKDLRRGFGGGFVPGTVMKPVYYGVDANGNAVALKYSTTVLTNSLLENHPGLQALRNQMELNLVDELIFKSGVKIGAPKVLSQHGYPEINPETNFETTPLILEESILTLNNNSLRLQFDPTADPNALVSSPTQLVYMINTNGLNAKAAKDYYSAMSELINMGTTSFLSDLGLMNSTGDIKNFLNLNASRRKAIETKIRNLIIKTADTKESVHKEAEVLSSRDNKGNYSVTINFPAIVNKVFQHLASSLSNSTVRIKFPGSKLVLQSAYGATIKDEVTGLDRPLRHITGNKPYAEVLMPRVHSDKFKLGDLVYNDYMLGFRIPSTELHSSVVLKVVGFYDAHDSNVIIAPKELIAIHGSDFDVDSLFVIRKGHSTDKSKSGDLLYVNDTVGLRSRKGTILFGVNEVIPSTDTFIRKVEGDINFFKNQIQTINRTLQEKLANSSDSSGLMNLKKESKKNMEMLLRVKEAALKNKMLDIYLSVITDKKNRSSILTPISMSNLKGRVENGVDLDNSVFKTISEDMGLPLQEEHNQLYAPRDLSNPLDEMYMHQSNQSGSILTGAGANAMKALAYMMEGAGENTPSGLVSKRTEDGQIIPFEFVIDGITYSDLTRHEKLKGDKISKHTIWQTLDSIINAAIDNSREQILNIINLNQATASMFYVLIGTGVPLKTAVRILLQPSVKEAVRRNPRDFASGANSVREDLEQILNNIPDLNEEKINEVVEKTTINSSNLSRGVKYSNPKNNLPFDKQMETLEDIIFQHTVLSLLSPKGGQKGINSFGKDLTKVATALSILQKLPSTHEELTEKVETLNNLLLDNGNFGFNLSNLLVSLPHLQSAKDTVDVFYTITSQIFQVNSPELRQFAVNIMDTLGNTSLSEENLSSFEKNKKLREEYVRFVTSTTVSTSNIESIDVVSGNMTTNVNGSQALSHRLSQAVKSHPAKQSNSFLNRLTVNRDKRGVNYIVSDAAGITKPELAEVYSDFYRLDPELQEQFLQYSIAKEGMLFAGNNITMLLDPKLFAGYDQKRATLIEELLEDPKNLDLTKNRFLLQYALTNFGLIASTSSKIISEALVKEDNSIYGTRRATISTGETVFYDLKLTNNKVGTSPLLLSNPNYGQVYIRVHQDIVDEDSTGFSYYQTVAKGSKSASFYTNKELDLNTEFNIDSHFSKSVLVRQVEDVNVTEVTLYKPIKGLQIGDKIALREFNDVLRENAIVSTISDINDITEIDKETGIENTRSVLTLSPIKVIINTQSSTSVEPGVSELQKDKPLYQKLSYAQTISEEAMETIVSKLEKRFGMSAKIVNKPEVNWAGKFVAETPVINTANMRADTAFHEFSHPWVEAIFLRNRPLFEELKKELIKSPEGQAILAEVQAAYPELNGNEFFKEAIVTAIGKYAAGMIDEKGKGLGEKLFELIKQIGEIISKLWNSKAVITPEELSGMSLRQLALLLAEGDAKLDTSLQEFQNFQEPVTKNNFVNRLQRDGIIGPVPVSGYYAIMDIVPGTVEIRPDLYAKNRSLLEQYAQDYPGFIKIVGKDVRFNFDAPVENFETNAKYQLIENSVVDEAGFEKLVEEDTISFLEKAASIEKLKLSKDESKYEGISGVYDRVTQFVKVNVLGQSRDTIDSEYAAKRRFERNNRNIETDTIVIENIPYTYLDLVNKFQKKSNNSTARGKAVHKLIEWLVTKDVRILKELKEIQKEKPDQDEITDASLKWVESVGPGILRKIGYQDTDTMKAELFLHSPILSIATQIDGLIQHADGTLTLVDWKSGGLFLNDRTTAQMLRYSIGTVDTVSDSKLSKAKLELALRAIMIKEHHPNAKFKNILIHHLERNNPFKQPFSVDLKDYLLVVSNYLQAEKPLEYAALKEKGLLEASNYTTTAIRNSSALEKYSHQPMEEQILGLEKDIEILRTKIATPGLSNNLSDDKELLEFLTTEYLNLTKTSKETLNSEGSLGNFKAWASSIYNINSPRLQAFNKIFRKASQKYQNRVEDDKQIAQKLFKDLRDEYLNNNPLSRVTGLATLGIRSGFDYQGMYDFAFEERIDGVQTPGVYMLSLADATLKYQNGQLTAAQYNLLKHLRETWETNWSSLMDKKMESGNPYSKVIGMHNVDNTVVEGKLHPNFMPRIPMENSEAYERYRNQGVLNRNVKGSLDVVSNFARNTFSLFIEENYYGQTDSINAHIPVRYIGSAAIIADQLHSFNLEKMHYEFTSNLMRKQEMDFVVALGDGVKSYYNTMSNLKTSEDKGWKNYEKFMENFVINAVMQERSAGRGDHWSAKKYFIPNPLYNPNKPTTFHNRKTYEFSLFKLMMAVKHLTTGKALWFKVIGGTFNGAIITMYTTMKGVQGSAAKRLGYNDEVIDVTTSDLFWAAGQVVKYFADQIKRTFTNEPSNNKLHNLLKRFKYLPDNYDYAVADSDMMSLKNPTISYDKLFFFHAIHEEWGHALLLAAQMRRIKMPDGSSIWDSYNDDGTFKTIKDGKLNIRGVITEPSGVKRIISELTEDEISKMLKMSTDIHGAYRTAERTVLESTAVGVWALQFKKYLPALLIQEWETRKDDVYMGKYTQMTDDRGNKIQETIEIDGQMVTMDTMDWISWQHEGRAKVLLKAIAGTVFGGEYTKYKLENLNPRDKYDLIGILSKVSMFILVSFALAGIEDDDDDETWSNNWITRFEYLKFDSLQALHPTEILRTLKNPFAVITHANSIIETGWNLDKQIKNIPMLSAGHELERYGFVQR
jgi:hypothetical protein